MNEKSPSLRSGSARHFTGVVKEDGSPLGYRGAEPPGGRPIRAGRSLSNGSRAPSPSLWRLLDHDSHLRLNLQAFRQSRHVNWGIGAAQDFAEFCNMLC